MPVYGDQIKRGIIGLTGGIASGKSTVSRMLEENGAKIIDADRIARQAVQKGMPAWEKIIAYFGREILDGDGEINREHLGKIIFNNKEKKQRLNAIVHPVVMKETQRLIESFQKLAPESLIVLDVPLLLETGMDNGLSDIVVVWVPEAIQLERLMKRDHLSPADAQSRIASQMPIDEKRKKATLVIDNSGDLEQTKQQVLSVYNRLQSKYFRAMGEVS